MSNASALVGGFKAGDLSPAMQKLLLRNVLPANIGACAYNDGCQPKGGSCGTSITGTVFVLALPRQ